VPDFCASLFAEGCALLFPDYNIVSALDNGAADYLTKPFRTGELLARIRSALRRELPHDQHKVIASGDLEIDLVARTIKRKGEIVKLTATEKHFALGYLFLQ